MCRSSCPRCNRKRGHGQVDTYIRTLTKKRDSCVKDGCQRRAVMQKTDTKHLKRLFENYNYINIHSSLCQAATYNNANNIQLLDEVEQNIVIYQCQWRADQLFADAEGRGK